MKRWIIGIDEAGRGPIAGPVAVGLFAIPYDQMVSLTIPFKDVKDSKQLSEKKREEWFERIKEWTDSANSPQENLRKSFVEYRVAMVGPQIIDREGITKAVRIGIARVIKDFPSDSRIFLDGLLKAPRRFIDQETIVKGDEKEPLIALASIVAKVTRDRKMVRLAKQFPQYGFEKNKGYGTREHRAHIMEHGACVVHRKSYLTRL